MKKQVFGLFLGLFLAGVANGQDRLSQLTLDNRLLKGMVSVAMDQSQASTVCPSLCNNESVEINADVACGICYNVCKPRATHKALRAARWRRTCHDKGYPAKYIKKEAKKEPFETDPRFKEFMKDVLALVAQKKKCEKLVKATTVKIKRLRKLIQQQRAEIRALTAPEKSTVQD